MQKACPPAIPAKKRQNKEREMKTNILLRICWTTGVAVSIAFILSIIGIAANINVMGILVLPFVFYMVLTPVFFMLSLVILLVSVTKNDRNNKIKALISAGIYFVLSIITYYIIYAGRSI